MKINTCPKTATLLEVHQSPLVILLRTTEKTNVGKCMYTNRRLFIGACVYICMCVDTILLHMYIYICVYIVFHHCNKDAPVPHFMLCAKVT